MGTHHIRIHGTYPWDSSKRRWNTLRSLSFEEACDLAQVPAATRAMWPTGYPWLNKGYIVLGAPKEAPSLTSLQAAFMEGAGGELGLKNWPDGVQAVYLHDGKFFLLELQK